MQQPRRRITVVIWQRRRHRRIQRTQPQIIVQHKRRMDMICTQWWVVKKSTDLHQQKKNVAFGPNQHARHMQQHNRCNRSLRFFLVFVFAPINQSISPIHIAHMPCQSPWRMLIFSACSQLYFLHSWHLSPFIWIEINANIYYKTIQIENNAATICNIFLVFVILIFRLTAFLRHIESAISREPKQRP